MSFHVTTEALRLTITIHRQEDADGYNVCGSQNFHIRFLFKNWHIIQELTQYVYMLKHLLILSFKAKLSL